MILSPHRRFVFVHIPKCAGTSVTYAYAPHTCANDLIIGATPEGEAIEREVDHAVDLHKHSRAAAIADHLGREAWNGMFTFTIVRNPWARLASYYTWCRKYDHTYAICEPACAGSFPEFLRSRQVANLARGSQMTDWLQDAEGRIMVNFVGRAETLQRDVSAAFLNIGVPLLRLQKRNRSHGDTSWRQMYDAESRALVGDLFARDIEMFGYHFGSD